MGVVYRVWDMRLNAPLALKELTPQPGLDAATLAQLSRQFEQEASVLANLSHPFLVDVTDFFEEGGNDYLVMKFVEGESLADRIEREGALPESEVLTWADQLLNALSYCHAQGVIHRDIKPQNVILRPDGRVVLIVGSQMTSRNNRFVKTIQRRDQMGPVSDSWSLLLTIDLYRATASCAP